jgi:hypothetical protein
MNIIILIEVTVGGLSVATIESWLSKVINFKESFLG